MDKRLRGKILYVLPNRVADRLRSSYPRPRRQRVNIVTAIMITARTSKCSSAWMLNCALRVPTSDTWESRANLKQHGPRLVGEILSTDLQRNDHPARSYQGKRGWAAGGADGTADSERRGGDEVPQKNRLRSKSWFPPRWSGNSGA